MKVCQYCGKELKDDMKICPNCGPGSKMIFCGHCGKRIPENAIYCPACGMQIRTPVSVNKDTHKAKSKISVKYLVATVAILAVVFIGVNVLSSLQSSKNPAVDPQENDLNITGYDSPEAAVEAFMLAFKEQDVEKMLSTFDTYHYLEFFDYEDCIDRIRGASASMQAAPTEYEIYKEFMRLQLQRDRAASIQIMSYSILCYYLDDAFFDLQPILADRQWAERFIEYANPETLEDLKIIEYRNPLTEEFQEKLTTIGKEQYGSDDHTERVVFFEIGDQLYYKGFQLLCYDERWYLYAIGSRFTEEDLNGQAIYIEGEVDLDKIRAESTLCNYTASRQPVRYNTNEEDLRISEGFSSPDAAVNAFLTAFKAQDTIGMLETFDIEPYLENVDYATFTDYLGVANAKMAIGPVEYDFHRALLKYRLLGEFADDMKMMVYSFLYDDSEDGFLDYQPVSANRQWAEKFSEAVDPNGLQNIKLLYSLDALNAAENREYSIDYHCQRWGCDSYAERLVILEKDGTYYRKGFSLVEYGGKWYIHYLLTDGGYDSEAVAKEIESETDLIALLEKYN